MLMLLCAVTTWAFTPGENITTLGSLQDGGYVFFKNVGRNKYIYEGADKKMLHGANAESLAYLWQVHQEEGGKFSFSSITGGYISTPIDGGDVYTVSVDNDSKDEFTITAHQENSAKWKLQSTNNSNIYWDGQDARFVGWQGSGLNSQFEIIPVEVSVDEITEYFSNAIETLKNTAIAELNNLATVSVIYPAATVAVEAIEAVEAEDAGLAELNAAIEAINNIVADYKTGAYKALSGKYYTIQTLSTERSKGFMQMATSNIVGTENASNPANLWQFVENNGAVNVYNPYTGLYMCEPSNTNSVEIAVTDKLSEAGAYHLVVNASAENADAKIKFTSNGKSVHMAGGHNLVRWDNGGASEWKVVHVTNFSSIIDAYKASTISSMDQWKNLSVVFDASLIEGAKTAIDDINTNSFATIAAIDAEIKKVTDAVAAKMFTFQTLATDSHRENVWVSANPSTGKAIGLHGESNYNSIWSLRHAGGVSFYMFNELNQVYMGAPSANCPLTETPSVAYTFEIIDAANGVVEMKCNGETMHASNHGDDKLLNYDGDEAASRWYIRTIDVAADIQTIIEGLTDADYADVPALGQYPTAAYNALVEARTSAKTVEAVEAAIAAFKKAKNRPVFTINGVISYAAGKSLYDDEDGRPNFKATNKYDRAMWWVFDQTTTTVGLTESVDVVNYATGRGFWGEKALKITETSDPNENDGIFLFYTVGNNNPLHYQDANQVITRYGDTTSTSGSATTFTYVGNTYDLDKLTDEKIAALSALQTAYDNKADFVNAELGEGLGKYTGSKDEIVAAEAAAKEILEASVAEQAAKEVAAIEAAATALNEGAAKLIINMPAAGKYYRIQGACEAAEGYENFYITGHTNGDGGRIALTKEADASTIYYFDGTNLIAYQSGLVIGLNNGHWTFASIDDNTKPASTITFAQSPRTAGAYTVKSADRYLHYFYYSANNTVQVNRCQDDVCKEHDWYLTEVTELPVTVTNAGYATFYAPVAVSVPSGVTAHTVTVNDGWVTLSEKALEVVPANTGVVLVGEGSYNFAVTTAAAFEGTNLMAGTVAKTLVTKAANTECYVLANGENGVGMYAAVKGEDATKFYNAGHKAYLVVEDAPGAPASYSFRFGEGTTAIENVEVENTVKAIYDLTGRRVEAITAAGIYIVNGKKTLVK